MTDNKATHFFRAPPSVTSFHDLFCFFWNHGIGRCLKHRPAGTPWTREDLEAEFAGHDREIDVRTIDNWRSGKNLPSKRNLVAIAEIAGSGIESNRRIWADALFKARASEEDLKKLKLIAQTPATSDIETPEQEQSLPIDMGRRARQTGSSRLHWAVGFAAVLAMTSAIVLKTNTADTEALASQPLLESTLLPEPLILTSDQIEKTRKCDEIAGHHQDQTLPSGIEGRTITEIRQDPLNAIRTCMDAVSAVPTNARMHLNLSRTYIAAQEWEPARKFEAKAAELGSIRAIMALGLHYVDGDGDNRQDFDIARRYFENADLQGEPTARAILARFAAESIHEDQDLEKAFKMSAEAARKGYNRAQYNTAIMLINGIGTEKDIARAFTLLSVSIQNSAATPFAHTQLGWMHETGMGLESPDIVRAIEYYQDGRRYGDRLASLALAKLHLMGKSIPQNVDVGMSLLEEAMRTEFDSLKDDVLWIYQPSPQFDQLTIDAISQIRQVTTGLRDPLLISLLDQLELAYQNQKLPIQEEILCEAPEDRENIRWCVGFLTQ